MEIQKKQQQNQKHNSTSWGMFTVENMHLKTCTDAFIHSNFY